MLSKASLLIAFIFCFASINSSAQNLDDTEFKKGWILLLQINNGLLTNFKASPPDLYAGGISLNPQFTIVEHKLRLGANAGFVYTDKKLSGLFGPMLAYKIKNFNAGNFGGLANLHVLAMAQWGTAQQQLAGAGLGLEALQKIHLAFTAQRDYHLNYWWLQSHIGFKLNKAKKKIISYQ